MRPADHLDKGASLGPDAPCLTTDGVTSTYAEVVALSFRISAALAGRGVSPGDKVAVLSGTDPVAFTCVFGISRAGAVRCPINPRNEAAETRELRELTDCTTLIFAARYAPMVARIAPHLPALTTLVCLDGAVEGALGRDEFPAGGTGVVDRPALDDLEVSGHGWHHTGDIGYLDEDGFLFVVDRAKDMVITGGFNVHSTEVEQAVMAHPAVQDCAVVGLPDDKWGERVTAVVRLRPGAALGDGEPATFVKDRIGSVKTPKQVEIWPDLARSRVGKILKTDINRSLTAPPG